MIPQGQYDPRRAEALKRYLIDELRREMGARGPLEQMWISWVEAYKAIPFSETKDFPFENAANLVIPVIATDVDTMFARLLGLVFEPKNLWTLEAKRPEFVEAVPRMQEFLEWAQANELNLYQPVADWMLEICKLGTGILKQRYTRDQKKVFEWRELSQGTWQQQAIVLLKDSPSVHHVRLHDFYVPAGYKELQEAPWCAERITLNYQQFTNRVRAGIYEQRSLMGSWWANQLKDAVQQEFDRISQHQVSYGQFMELFEFNVEFDIDGDGYDEALICTIHLQSEDYVRLDYNPFFNQQKPYSVARFLRDGNSFYGIGLSEMLNPFQEEISTMHNQRLDNATVNNTTVLACRADETSITDQTPIYPGRVFKLQDPQAMKSLQLGTKYDSTIQAERESLAYASRRTGVNDYITGQNSPDIGYGTAYTTAQMIAASTKRFGETLREIQIALAETGTQVLELYQQFNQRGKEYYALGPVAGTMVHMVLQFPLDLIRRGLRVNVTAMDPAGSKDVRIRNQTQILQMLMQFYQQYMQGLGYAINPQMPPIIRQTAMQMLQGASTLMRRLLETYGEPDGDSLVPTLTDALTLQQQQLAQLQSALIGVGGVGPQSQPGGGVPGASGFPGMGANPGASLPAPAASVLGSPFMPPNNPGGGGPNPQSAGAYTGAGPAFGVPAASYR